MSENWIQRFFEGPYQREYFEYAGNAERTALEVAFIVSQLEIGPQSKVLDLACGAGRHALGVAEHAHAVIGTDITPAYIEVAQAEASQRGLTNTTFTVADMRELSADAEYDAAYNYFTAWGYYDHATNLDVLRRIQLALKPGGRFLLEILSRDRLMTIFKARDYSESEGGALKLENREFDFVSGRLHNRRTYIAPDGSRSVLEFDHYVPSSDALVRHLKDAGFGEVQLLEAPTGAPLSLSSPRLAALAHKV